MDRRRILKVIESDAKFFEEHFLMDYSLLVAVEENYIQSSKWSKDKLDTQHSINSLSDKLVSLKRENSSSNEHRSSVLMGKGHTLYSSCGSYIYHISLIDYLQRYNL